MKKLIFILTLFVTVPLFSQIEYGYERPKSSIDPWKFGINVGVSQDWINQNNGIEKKIGWKAGLSGEKHLVYNIYFRPVFNLVKKGFVCDIEDRFKEDVNGYLLDLELTIELKFGDERAGRGFIIYFAPFFTYGIGGTSTYTNQNPDNPGNPGILPDNYKVPIDYKTFADGNYAKEDVGYILGVGYDINHHIELNFNYMMGFLNVGRYTNFRWRNLSFGLTYFF